MPRQRGETWRWEETLHFLSLFGDLDVQEELIAQHRNQAVYEKLAGRMKELGYNRTAYQLRIKAKDLKKQYRHMRINNRKPSQGRSFWKYCHLLDSAFHKTCTTEPVEATSVTREKGTMHTEELSDEPSVDEPLCPDKSQGCGEPCGNLRASQTLLDASCGAGGGAGPSSLVGAFSKGNLHQRPASKTKNLVKRKFKKSWPKTLSSKTFLEYCKNIEKSQKLFQDHMDIERQERKKIQKEASRSRKEIKAAASQMREAILVQAEAVNKVADAINRYNDLLECFISGPDQQRVEEETLQDSSGIDEGKQLFFPTVQLDKK